MRRAAVVIGLVVAAGCGPAEVPPPGDPRSPFGVVKGEEDDDRTPALGGDVTPARDAGVSGARTEADARLPTDTRAAPTTDAAAADRARSSSGSDARLSASDAARAAMDSAAPTPVSGEPCTAEKTLSGGQSGNFGTADGFCFRTPDELDGWGCSNFSGRTVKVNGVMKTCGAMPLPAKVNGYLYFESTAGTVPYASIHWWGKFVGTAK